MKFLILNAMPVFGNDVQSKIKFYYLLLVVKNLTVPNM